MFVRFYLFFMTALMALSCGSSNLSGTSLNPPSGGNPPPTNPPPPGPQNCSLGDTIEIHQKYQYEAGLASYPYGTFGDNVDDDGNIYFRAVMRDSSGYKSGIRALGADKKGYFTLTRAPAGAAGNAVYFALFVDEDSDNIHILDVNSNNYYFVYDKETGMLSAGKEIDDAGCTGGHFIYLYANESSGLVLVSGTNFSSREHVLCRSTNNGDTFTEIIRYEPTLNEYTLFSKPYRLANGDFLLPGGFENAGSWVMGVRKSTDDGATWSDPTVAQGAMPFKLIDDGGYSTTYAQHVFQVSNGTVFLTGAAKNVDGETESIIMKSEDNGDTWSFVNGFLYGGSEPNIDFPVQGPDGKIYFGISGEDSEGKKTILVARTDDEFVSYSILASYQNPAVHDTLILLEMAFDSDGNLQLFIVGRDDLNVEQAWHARLPCE